MGLRVAAATTLCVLLTELFHLHMGYLSVISAHIVMSQYQYTSFQKGVERIFGRVSGVWYGLLVVEFFHEKPFLFLGLMAAGQMAAGYLYASGRLNYAALQFGVFSPVVAEMGLADPASIVPTAQSIIWQVVLGVGAAILVNWLTGAEGPAFIETKGPPLWPLRGDWLSQGAMLATTAMTTMLASLLLELPVTPAMVSAMLLVIVPDLQALRRKAGQRALAVLIGGAYAFVGLFLLARLPHFGLLLALSFLAMFCAAYFTRASANYSYAALQTGFVIPMVLICTANELGSFAPAVQRFIGIGVGVLISMTVHYLWPVVPAPAAPSSLAPSLTLPAR